MLLAETAALPSLIKPLLCLRTYSALPLPHLSVPLIPLTNTLYFHSRRRAFRAVTLMAGNNSAAAAAENSPEHVVGDWYSVPDLRLRDHRFSVPLDYSADRRNSSKISIFAREVVSGALLTFDWNQDLRFVQAFDYAYEREYILIYQFSFCLES